MRLLVPTRGSRGDQNARDLFPLPRRQGAKSDDVSPARERPVDTIAVARGLAEEQ